MRIVSIVAAVEYLILILNLIVVWQLGRVVHANFSAAITCTLNRIRVLMADTARKRGCSTSIIWSIVEATAVAPTTSMAHHHLCIV